MRIVISVGRYEPHVGGSEEVCRQLAIRLVRRGHEVTVATGAHGERQAEMLNGVRIAEFACEGNFANGMHGEVDAYQALLHAGDFDLSFHYAAQIWTTDLVLPLLGTLPRPAVIAPCGYSGLFEPGYRSYFSELGKVLSGFAAVVHHSDIYRDAQYAREHEVPRCFVIPNGVCEDEFSLKPGAFREQLGIDPQRPLVLTVGNHTNQKGHARSIKAFQAVAPPDALFAIVGKVWHGGCYEVCRRAADADPRILLLTEASREVAVQAFKDADVYLFASDIECAPLVILEAMASGLAWISTDRGNVRELQGGIVSTDAELEHYLRALLTDPVQRTALGEEGYAAFEERHRWEVVVDGYEQLFERVLSGELKSDPVDARAFRPDLHRIRGENCSREERWTEAVQQWEVAVADSPADPLPRQKLIEALLATESQDTEALERIHELLADALEQFPWEGRKQLAWFLMAGALDKEVSPACRRADALGLPVQDFLAFANKGNALVRQRPELLSKLLQEVL